VRRLFCGSNPTAVLKPLVISFFFAEDCVLKTYFNIGCNVLLYRDSHDKIGYHANDSQEEVMIFTAIVLSEHPRYLHLLPKGKKKDYKHGDVHIKLYAGKGDAYSMDGK
jgi:hypothetical protein